MVVDEAHVLKTALAMRTMAMKNIPARCYFALTGKEFIASLPLAISADRITPGTLIQNRYSEMWSILDFVSGGTCSQSTRHVELMALLV